ncbi:MAG TPA: hypothetical protein VGB85_11605 [Nannocystis sp.]|jgi:hypothetical protein
MDPKKNFKPSHDVYDKDRDGPDSGVNQVNPHNTENQGGDPVKPQGGDPAEIRPQVLQVNRDAQGDEPRDIGFDGKNDAEQIKPVPGDDIDKPRP